MAMCWKCGSLGLMEVRTGLYKLYHALNTFHRSKPTDIHPDVGGGNVPNTQPRALSNIPLRWMVRQVMACGCGIRFDEAALERLKIPLHDPLSAIPASPTEASAEEAKLNSLDALEPIYDALVVKKVWWILEIMFLYYSWQDEKGVWHSEYRYVFFPN